MTGGRTLKYRELGGGAFLNWARLRRAQEKAPRSGANCALGGPFSGGRLSSTRPRIKSRRVCSQLRAWPPQGNSPPGLTIAWHAPHHARPSQAPSTHPSARSSPHTRPMQAPGAPPTCPTTSKYEPHARSIRGPEPLRQAGARLSAQPRRPRSERVAAPQWPR